MVSQILLSTSRCKIQTIQSRLLTIHPIQGHNLTVVLIYVKNIILIGNNLEQINELKKFLGEQFKDKYLGNLKYFLGIEVA